MDIKIKNLVYEILAGFIVALVTYLIVVDEIAINAGMIATKYGYTINLTTYESLSITSDYMKILGGITVIYGQIGGIIENFLANHFSDVLSLGFNRGDAARFLFASTFPFIAGAIFVGLMSRNMMEYTVSVIISSILTPIVGYAFNPTNTVYLFNSIEFALIGLAVGFIPGLFFNIFGSRIFEEKNEAEVKEVDVDIDVGEVPEPDEDLEIDLDEEIELEE